MQEREKRRNIEREKRKGEGEMKRMKTVLPNDDAAAVGQIK